MMVQESAETLLANSPVVENTIAYSDEKRGIDIVVFPADEFRVTFMVDYENPVIGKKYTSIYDMPSEFETEYAPARTFCFLSEVEMLHKHGLIKGGRKQIFDHLPIAGLDQRWINFDAEYFA